jgi:hypothetical protein
LRGTVTIYKRRSWTYEGERRTDEATTNVDFKFERQGNGQTRAEVYAGYQDGRKALFTALEGLLGIRIPQRRGARQEQILAPIRFTEHQVKRFADARKMDMSSIHGIDPSGEVAEVAYFGRKAGITRSGLDTSVSKVASQDVVDNDFRSYAFGFRHADGYKENSEIRFVMKATQPYLAFTERCSGDAQAHVIADFCGYVG